MHLIQDLNLGDNMNVSSRWSITNAKKHCRQIDLSVFCFMFSVGKYVFFSKMSFVFRYNVL